MNALFMFGSQNPDPRCLFVISFFGRDDRRIAGEHEMDAWVRYEVRLEPDRKFSFFSCYEYKIRILT